MKRIIFLIVLTVVLASCNSIRTRNLTGQIVLNEIKESSDTVDFYIKQIQLINVERLKPVWIENAPGLNLIITITNKLNKSIYLIPSDWSKSYFVGILPQELNLTHIAPHQFTSLSKSSTFIFSNSDLCTTNFRLVKGRDLYFRR